MEVDDSDWHRRFAKAQREQKRELAAKEHKRIERYANVFLKGLTVGYFQYLKLMRELGAPKEKRTPAQFFASFVVEELPESGVDARLMANFLLQKPGAYLVVADFESRTDYPLTDALLLLEADPVRVPWHSRKRIRRLARKLKNSSN